MIDSVACEINLLDFALGKDQSCTLMVYGFSRKQNNEKDISQYC